MTPRSIVTSQRWLRRTRSASLATCLFMLAACAAGVRPSASAGPNGTATQAMNTPSPSVAPVPSLVPIAALQADLKGPVGLAVDQGGDLYVAQCEGGSSVIDRIDRHGQLTRFAGTGTLDFAGDGGAATAAMIGCPVGMAFGPDGALYFADHANNRVRRVDTNGIITTVAGSGPAGVDQGSFSGDGGQATAARLQEPWDVTFDRAGDLFIADRDNLRVRRVDPSGVISTVAGDGKRRFTGDGGPAIEASIWEPLGIAVDARGQLLIADSGNNRVRSVGLDGIIDTFGGTGAQGFTGDGSPATVATIEPTAFAFDASGALLIAGSGRIRRVDFAGTITTIAGSGTSGKPVDGTLASKAHFGDIYSIAVDQAGSVYVADGFRNVYRIDDNGVVTLYAGKRPTS